MESEAARQHAGDRHRNVVDLDWLADDLWIAVPVPLPQVVADVDRRDPLRTDVAPRDHPSDERRHAERVEKVVARRRRGDGFHLAWSREIARRLVDHRDRFEQIGPRSDGRQLFAGDERLADGARAVRAKQHEAIGLVIGKRLQQDGADDGEDGGRRADAERHDGQRRRGERLISEEDPCAVTKIAEQHHADLTAR